MKKLALFLILIFSLQLIAQNEVGSIRGIVTDEMGAVLPNSKVKVTPIIDGKLIEEKSLSAVADNNGEFNFNNLPVGLYEIEITVSGVQATIRKKVNVKKSKSSQSSEKLELYVIEPCSDISETTDLTTESDKAEIVKEIIKEIIVYDKSNPILSTENIKASWLGEEKQRFILMSPSEIQYRADTKGDFERYRFPIFKVKGSCVEISWSYGLAQGKNSTTLYMSREGKIYEFRKINGKWSKRLFSSWVS